MALLDDSNLRTLTRHDEYYISSGDVSILVEHVQFRVHKFFFERESKFFAGKLSTPASPGTPLQGSGDGNAIVLDGLTADEFAKFLWVFYNRTYSIYEAETEEWESILALAHRWTFPEVKNLAIRELEKKDLPDVKRIKLYHDNNVDRTFLIPRYAALCEREAPLTLAEGRDLGMETTLMIARGREEARASRTANGARSPLTPTIHGADLHEFIRELFEIGAEGTADAEPPAAHLPGALAKTRTEPPPTATATVTPTPSTPNPTQKATPASRPQKETPTKPAAKAGAATKKGKTTAGQQTKTTPKPETPVQETTPSPTHPLPKEVNTATTATTTKEASGASPEALVTPSADTANGTDSTTPLDPTSPLHITTDTTANGNGTTGTGASFFDDLSSFGMKGNSSVPKSAFGDMTSFSFGANSIV